jgi:hypothetical protein
VPEVGPILEDAAELQARARHLRFSLGNTGRRLSELEGEIARRQQAQRLMGFDALYLAAHFSRDGLPEIESPYELEPGEVAYLATGAALASPRPGGPYESPGTGTVPPAEFTGVPHWMGAFREGQAPVDPAGMEPGTMLLTSQRLAFAGANESAAIWLDSAVDIDIYQDAIAVLHMTSARPMILRLAAPREVAFYINWAVRQPALEER